MLLDIIIPQYNEDELIIKNLLDSIVNQKNIDFNLINVTIVNDASNVRLTNEFLLKYQKLNIVYLINDKNTGPGLARQKGIDNTDNEYIMFCDSDDMLINNDVLSKIIPYLISNKPDYLVTNIDVEMFLDNQKILVLKKGKETFPWMHGKVFKREFLVKNNIRFHDQIRHLEDSYFTSCIIGSMPSNQISYLDVTTYLWKANQNSLTRANRKYSYMVDTFYDYIKCPRYVYEYLCNIKSKMRFPYFVKSSIAIYTVLNSDLFSFKDLEETRLSYLNDFFTYTKAKKNIFNLFNKDILKAMYEEEIKELKLRNNVKAIYKGLDDLLKELKE